METVVKQGSHMDSIDFMNEERKVIVDRISKNWEEKLKEKFTIKPMKNGNRKGK